jgi:hypothetical protein
MSRPRIAPRVAPRVALISLFAILIGCQPAPPKTPATAADKPAGPTVRATVITLRTTMEPEKRTVTQTLVINGDRARDTSEHDEWRLFDTKANTVTFVDDIARTFRTETLQKLIAQRRAVTKGALPPHYPRARIVRPKTKKTMQGASAESIVIESGAYKRELWVGEHPSIPRGLFAMMEASDPPTEPLAPMMRDVDEVLIALRGFPLADHAEVPVAKAKLVVDRSVISIATKDVQEALLKVPASYKDLTPKKQ